MYDSDRSSLDWAQQVCNAKIAAGHVYSLDRRYEGDIRILLEWIFYHDALARFSVNHWSQRNAGMLACMEDHRVRQALKLSGSSSKVGVHFRYRNTANRIIDSANGWVLSRGSGSND
jgi:hypothetical protein